MDHIDLQAYIAQQKNVLQDYQDELNHVTSLELALKNHQPVKWYNNAYYHFKRGIFIVLSIIIAVFVVYLLFFEAQTKAFFDQHLAHFVQEYINETFGAKIKSSIGIELPFINRMVEQVLQINVKESLQLQIVDQVYQVLRYTVIGLTILLIVLFLYISRLTKKLYQKNKIIAAYYQATLDYTAGYKNLIEIKKNDIDFLSRYANNKK